MIFDNVNTKEYWDKRFSSGDWEDKSGRRQTQSFASAQIPHLRIIREFAGTIVDFGCGLGDAMPIYRRSFPNATLIGFDISESAISKCKERYGEIASFFSGTWDDVPNVDVVVSSNVFEHLSNDLQAAVALMRKCKQLYVVVPYKEFPLCSEHVRSYDELHFCGIGEYDHVIFPSRGWSEYGRQLFGLQMKNLMRAVRREKLEERRMQIMFRFSAPTRQMIQRTTNTIII